MNSRALALVLFATLFGTVACASGRYIYEPEENATARISGRPAAYYPVPPQAPRGDVRVATLGIATLQSPSGHGPSVHVMHVRMIVDDNADTVAWQVDTREQLGGIGGFRQSRPAFASVSPGRPPVVTIAPGASATLDLFYPLPADMEEASEIPRFELLWKLGTSAGPVAERATFERLRIESAPPPGAYASGEWWGPGWYGWHEPLWPGAPELTRAP
jgi:hypothetical protein